MPEIGSRCHELRVNDRNKTWRLLYRTDDDAIIILDVFEKKTNKIAKYLVADPKVCHGKPTFRGTRIMVWQVMEQVASGISLDDIVSTWSGSIPKDAIVEIVTLA